MPKRKLTATDDSAKSSSTSANPCITWDFTIFVPIGPTEDKDKWTGMKDQLRSVLKSDCKSWCFQLERAPSTQRLHFQGRLKLKEKKRRNQVVMMFQDMKPHITPTSKENMSNMFYVQKQESRVQGPWKDTDLYVPRQVREIQDNLYPWQSSVTSMIKEWSPRTIHCMVERGNIGKSRLLAYMCTKDPLMTYVPLMADAEDILAACLDRNPSEEGQCYLVDIPKAVSKPKLRQLFSALERLKDGYLFDKRYSFREKWIDSPGVMVFCNTAPDVNWLSDDRWKFWSVNDKMELVPDGSLQTSSKPVQQPHVPVSLNDFLSKELMSAIIDEQSSDSE